MRNYRISIEILVHASNQTWVLTSGRVGALTVWLLAVGTGAGAHLWPRAIDIIQLDRTTDKDKCCKTMYFSSCNLLSKACSYLYLGQFPGLGRLEYPAHDQLYVYSSSNSIQIL